MNAPSSYQSGHRESSDTYRGEIFRHGRWRIIAGRCGIQWVLQFQARAGGPDRARWEARHYFRKRETAVRLWYSLTGEDGAILAALLPERIGRPRNGA